MRIESWRRTYRGIIPDAYLDAMSVEHSTPMWERALAAGPNATTVVVAEGDDGVRGFACGLMLAEPKLGMDAELSAIYLAADCQRQGTGRRLVSAVAAAQRAHGASSMLVWVIASNRGARAFYERLGAELLREQPFQWDGIDLAETGYGWRDLAVVADTAALPMH